MAYTIAPLRPDDASVLTEYARELISEGYYTFRDTLEMTEAEQKAYISDLSVPPQAILGGWTPLEPPEGVLTNDEADLPASTVTSSSKRHGSRIKGRSPLVGVATLTSPTPYKSTSHRAVLSISVRRAYRHQGIGNQLLTAIIDFARQDPTLKQIELTVFSDNPIAIKFYESFGFTRIGQIPRVAKLSHYVDGILMYRGL